MFKSSGSVIDDWFGGRSERPKWKQEFEQRIWEIEKKTGLTKKELLKVAEVMEELKIVRV